MASGLKPDQKPANKLAELVAGKSNGTLSDAAVSFSSSKESKFRTQLGVDSNSLSKNESHEETMGKHAKTSPAASISDSRNSGYGGSFRRSNDRGHFQADGSCMAMHSDNGSMLYYIPSYDLYAFGSIVGFDGQNVGQHPYYTSSGYLQHPVSYGSETIPPYSWNSTYVSDLPSGKASLRNGNSSSTPYSANFNGTHSTKPSANFISRSSNLTSSQPVYPARKVSKNGYDFMAGPPTGYLLAGNSPQFSGHKEGQYPNKSQIGCRPHESSWNGHSGRGSSSRNNDPETATELVRGPRALNKGDSQDSFVKMQDIGFALCKDQYNLPDFKIELTIAKFYVIKSYSEDDVHKSIKYSVWSSTPHGNKKLNAAFREAEERTNENGTNCPVFLFFSVNKSGQFVGMAEMVGPVDFNKDMDFWQVDKWSGFFPLKWHIIKDVPHSCLQHIVLGDGRDVTFTRDTHEIGLKQGLEMLKIFKSYTAKTSLLDDLSFYENREKSLQKSKTNKPTTPGADMYNHNGSHKHGDPETRFANNGGAKSCDMSSLNKLTENLSLNGYHKTNASFRM